MIIPLQDHPISNVEIFLRELIAVKIETNNIQNSINSDILKIKSQGTKNIKKIISVKTYVVKKSMLNQLKNTLIALDDEARKFTNFYKNSKNLKKEHVKKLAEIKNNIQDLLKNIENTLVIISMLTNQKFDVKIIRKTF